MSKLNKFVSMLLLLVFISPFLTTAAFALECEDPNVSSMRAKGREFKAATATGAGIADPDQKAEQDQMSEEDKLGLFGKVMNCATLFLQAGMSPGNIKKAACSMKCFTSIKDGCDYTFKRGVITFKKGAPAYAICPAIMPLVLAF